MLKILNVIDQYNWAYHFTAIEVKKFLSDEFEIDILDQKDFLEQKHKLNGIYDNIYFQNWAYQGLERPQYLSNLTSHGFDLTHIELSDRLVPEYRAIMCVSQKIMDICKIRFPAQKLFIGEIGVDSELFYPIKKPRTKKFTVGFSSKEMKGTFQQDLKGYNTILVPLMERMKKYPNIEFLNWNRNHTNAIPHSEMPAVYHKMDCMLVTSFREGTPGSVHEGSASGLPIIGTDVGTVSRAIHPDMVIPAFNTPEDVPATLKLFEKKILQLFKDRDLCDWHGNYNRDLAVKEWNWKKQSEQWRPFFKHGLDGKKIITINRPLQKPIIKKPTTEKTHNVLLPPKISTWPFYIEN